MIYDDFDGFGLKDVLSYHHVVMVLFRNEIVLH